MPYSISLEPLDNLDSIYQQSKDKLPWDSVLMLPGWLISWWKVFGSKFEPFILAVYQDKEIIGVAPFKRFLNEVSFIGDASVCDYADFIVSPGMEELFCSLLLDWLPVCKVETLALETLRPESVSMQAWRDVATEKGKNMVCVQTDISFEMVLPQSWDSYLDSLESKQRHDITRKLRKMSAIGDASFNVIQDDDITEEDMGSFLNMMTHSRRDKSIFLTGEMRNYFKLLVKNMAAYGVVRLGFLNLGAVRVAAVLYFEYNKRIYLYNSGYNPDYSDLSVGLISKLFCIRESIANHNAVFDFLKGTEDYKYRLGGKKVDLFRCGLELKDC